MKPILRALLVIDGIITLILGLALVASPWANTIVALQAVAPQPPALGQLFGISLLGFAWLQLHAAYDGQLTLAVARVSGHVGWISGIVLLVWLIALHSATVDSNRAIVFSGPVIAIVLLVLGLGLVRIASAVSRRNRQIVAGVVSADKAEREARGVREREREIAAERTAPVEPGFTRPVATPVRPAVDPVAGVPVSGVAPGATHVRTVVDPVTGEERLARTVVDPVTGSERLAHESDLRDPRDPRVAIPPDDIRRPL